ncbi:MAG: L,D-transpeptidase [Hyphomicrobium sp.]|uniref:L,D-transpeptidase n=1 Tax=Hyphomicrobium sp. TaxID=82 RepID=UPI001320B138|nr:L,D-transpeptidase [Hyphomicrobium sp.]KAB2940948.1 MAG: L,D-transpeptidase [Hyphomicrobium sp.]MBZ0211422.1 L,D-transpeptidase [Hyphomicrobium sp.]
MLPRVQALAFIAVLVLGLASGAARSDPALDYLESLKGSSERYKAPSELDHRYTVALYVNAAGAGPWRQRMWVLQRDGIGAPWRLAMWDAAHWKKAKLAEGETPSYSWPVSTGRYYRGDPFSGPTPTGVFALDERKWRYGRGYTAPGMIHTMYIDFHYDSGRRSGVAFHGTLPGRYRRLGSIDSHGCIRMKQNNAAALFDRITGRDKVLPAELRWGEVPRFWQSEKGQRRLGYTRDGSMHPAEALVADLGLMQASARSISDAERPAVLTKTGFRAIAVIFEN